MDEYAFHAECFCHPACVLTTGPAEAAERVFGQVVAALVDMIYGPWSRLRSYLQLCLAFTLCPEACDKIREKYRSFATCGRFPRSNG